MITALPIRAMIPSPVLKASRLRRRDLFGAGPLQVLGNPSEWKWAATIALVFFFTSLALAPALTLDQNKLAAEINSKTLKAAAAITRSTR